MINTIFKKIFHFICSILCILGQNREGYNEYSCGHLTIGDFKLWKIFKQNCEQKTHRFKLNREFHFTDMRIVTRMELEEILKEQISAVKVPSSHFEIRLGLRYV